MGSPDDHRSGRSPDSLRARIERAACVPVRHPYRATACIVSLLAGVLVFGLAVRLFPYHSGNHDEGVYLLQASMLLEGRVDLYAGELARAFRPWFFVEDGGRLYPKYAPVPAAIFAVGTALGEPRLSLGMVAAGNAALVYALVAAAWDPRTGAVAALALVGSPLFLLTSSVFLPYAPTFLTNLAFAFAYVRAIRRRSVGYAAAAGVAVGLAFFARPYTAVLFAAPFVGHTLWTLADGVRRRKRGRTGTLDGEAGGDHLRSSALVLGTVATLGIAFVLVTLAYNRLVTGSALLFPYEAFAPADGPGFGRREILDHSIEYTPRLAAVANAHLLWYLLTRWTVLGPIGAALAFVGVATHARTGRPADPVRLDAATLRWLFVGVVCTIAVGNAYFWGTYNALGTIDDPADGLVSLFGPFYHFDLLLPISGFAAAGALWIGGRVRDALDRRSRDRSDARGSRGDRRLALPRRGGDAPSSRTIARVALAVLVLASVPVAVAAEAAVLGPPIERNAAKTAAYEAAYEPFEETDLEGALVFVATPYGDWLSHPFQSLRNDPDLRGETVYALDRDPASDFAVLDAYPHRTPYRYTYRGRWTVDPTSRVIPKLERLETRSGERLTVRTAVGLPAGVRSASATVVRGDDRTRLALDADESADELVLDWALTPDGAGVASAGAGERPDDVVPVPETGTVSLLVTLTQREGATLTYRLDLAVRTDGDRLEVVWPAETKVCRLTTDCGREGTYLHDRSDEHVAGVFIEATLEGTDE